ncbi:MAG: hypothetical protein WCO63_04515 [Bacteroidota bacterium]
MKITQNIYYLLAYGLLLIATLSACQKTDLPPSKTGDPRLFIRGTFKNKNVDLSIGNSSVTGTPEMKYVSEDSMNVPTFIFNIVDNQNPSGLSVKLSFVNYASQFGVINNRDLDSTFKPGNKKIDNYFYNPANPFRLNTCTFLVSDSTGNYSSRKFSPDNSYCVIDSVSDLVWFDHKTYKMIYLSFNVMMTSTPFPDSTTFLPFSNGKAVIAFPKE